MKKTLIASVGVLAILMAPAYAQMGKINSTVGNDQQVQKQNAQSEKERAGIEKEYNDTMKRTRSQGPAPKSDPWSHVRPAGPDAKR